ncbi:MAG TPA: hypothetical protein DEB39_06185 [Planctomycetaceae bacterium]|nr:hypothetical protein [Planctomycetaceae bacterium]
MNKRHEQNMCCKIERENARVVSIRNTENRCRRCHLFSRGPLTVAGAGILIGTVFPGLIPQTA